MNRSPCRRQFRCLCSSRIFDHATCQSCCSIAHFRSHLRTWTCVQVTIHRRVTCFAVHVTPLPCAKANNPVPRQFSCNLFHFFIGRSIISFECFDCVFTI